MGGAEMVKKIDLKFGCWQILVGLRDIQKTTYKAVWVLFECLVMLFRLTIAPIELMCIGYITYLSSLC